MPLFRLLGLALFITAIFLALAAAITRTTHIRMQLPGTGTAAQTPIQGAPVVLPPAMESGFDGVPRQANSGAVRFTSVPIVWPLIFTAGMGLVMWFLLPSETRRSSSKNTKHRSRRRR